ncbi:MULTISPECIES: DUF3290 family protein [unclassified Streptococcus]|uniref:DUF3290 family protein n=1 Tax=unclassified Streptococcus TaxID=2608887 RepID=UPI0018A92746|nr:MULTISPECIES: DUF3290 family protein [unclassified Streptococcus]MBF8970587.1 DUF3290 family protein [Streptococcus sp. NLN76]MBG9367515.1 DUF3290 family protein [Streptococcus sp. NLN64]MBJ6746328.1 DUF3290 family protein [Streptococcus sp. 121]
MKFYSYDFVLNQIRQDNWLLAAFLIALLLILGYTAFLAYRDKRDSKYRELVIILGLTLLVSGLSGFESLQANSQANNQYRTSIHFIEKVSENLKVKPNQVYVNTSAETNGALLYVDGQFYRAISGSEPDTYLLEKMDLHSFDLELVEVNQ